MSDRFVSIHEQITCVKREIETRISSYPRKIDRNTMQKNVADYEISCMQSVLKTLEMGEESRLRWENAPRIIGPGLKVESETEVPK